MDVWTKLSASSQPILLWGTGDGADKILDAFSHFGITAAGIFASDGFVRNRVFRGYKVLSYSDAVSLYGNFTVVVAFGSRLPDVIARMEELSLRHTLYIPDVPVVYDGAITGCLWTDTYAAAHKNELDNARSLLADEQSLALFDEIVSYKLTGEPRFLQRTTEKSKIWQLAGCDNVRSYCDLGAYTGDTVIKAAELMPNLEYVLAAEPDTVSFRKLTKLEIKGVEFDARNAATWDSSCSLPFLSARGRGSGTANTAGAAGRLTSVAADTLDNMLGEHDADFIKYDVEGAEARALAGSARTIMRFSPALIVAAYHRSDDLYTLPPLVKRLNPEYKLFMRRGRCFPAWELDLIAVIH